MNQREAKKKVYASAVEILRGRGAPASLFKGADQVGDHTRLQEEWDTLIAELDRRSQVHPRGKR